MELKDEESALRDYARSIALDPQMAEAHRFHGALLLHQGDKEGGLAGIRKAAELGDAEAKAYLEKGAEND